MSTRRRAASPAPTVSQSNRQSDPASASLADAGTENESTAKTAVPFTKSNGAVSIPRAKAAPRWTFYNICHYVFLLAFFCWSGSLICIMSLTDVQRALTHLHLIPGPHTIWGLDKPQEQWGLIGTRAFGIRYVSTQETIGVWHMLPSGPLAIRAAANKSEEYFNKALGKGCVVLYLHGNAFSRAESHRLDLYKIVTGHFGCHLVTFDYRGYGDSDGYPSEASQLEDAELVWRWLVSHAPAAKVVIWGHSLGGAVANLLCAKLLKEGGAGSPPAGLLLHSTFSSMVGAVVEYPLALVWSWIPHFESIFEQYWVDRYLVAPALKESVSRGLPVLLVHGDQDVEVRVRHSQILYDVAGPSPMLKRVVIEGGSHNDLERLHAPRLAIAVLDWFTELGLHE